jgi:hypothetical protein
MESLLEQQIEERKKNLTSGEVIVYSDNCNYNRYLVLNDYEVLTGDVLVQRLPDSEDDSYGEPEIITFGNLQYGWQLSRETNLSEEVTA